MLGSNESGQLGVKHLPASAAYSQGSEGSEEGQFSWRPVRVEALEPYPLADVACGAGHVVAVTKQVRSSRWRHSVLSRSAVRQDNGCRVSFGGWWYGGCARHVACSHAAHLQVHALVTADTFLLEHCSRQYILLQALSKPCIFDPLCDAAHASCIMLFLSLRLAGSTCYMGSQ